MKIVAYTALHYGSQYLNHAIRSVIDDVDEYFVLYSPVGSHGHRTNEPCPDTEEQLHEIARQAAGDKLRWWMGVWAHEGKQRDSIFDIALDADAIVVLDSDELYMPNTVKEAIQKGMDENVRHVRIPLVHHWRSFYKGFTHDPAAPFRVHLPKLPEGETTYAPNPQSYLRHMGYAIPPELMRYKWLIHGHLGELRQDCDWLNDVYLANRQYDCHPCKNDNWMIVEDITPPDFMLDHPYAHVELIE